MDNSFFSLFSFDIKPYVKRVEFKEGETIFHLGDETKRAIYLLEGFSKCSTIYPNGDNVLLDYAPSPSFYGELELLGIQKYTSSVVASTRCIGYEIDINRVGERLLDDPVFLKNLLFLTAQKLFRVNKVASDNIGLPLKKRLAKYILKNERDGYYNISHIKCSEYLSVSYRHLLFVFSSFEREGLIKRVGRGRYQILSLNKLLEEVKSDK